MNNFLVVAVFVILLLLLAGLIRVLRGPTDADRMMAAQLFGTQATAILLLLAALFDSSAIVNVALIFALLAAVATVAFVRGHPLKHEEE